MTYPPGLNDIRERLADYPAYADYSASRLQQAIDAAQAEIEAAVPRISESALDEAQTRLASSLCLDLAIYHLKRAVERTEDGDVPMAVWRERQDLNRRLEQLARLLESGGIVEPMERLPEVDPC